MKTVLVVDDDPDIRALITWKLTLAGFETIAEADGQAAILAAGGGSPTAPGVRPDIVLLDWTMPGIAGSRRAKRCGPTP